MSVCFSFPPSFFFLLSSGLELNPAPGAEDSLKLTTRHYAFRTKGRANPTCSLFTAVVGLLLCAFWPLRGGPLTRELNYHGNSHRRAHVSLSQHSGTS